MCTRRTTRTPEEPPFCTGTPPPFWLGTVPGTPQEPPFLYRKTLPGPFLDPVLHRNPPPSCTRTPFLYPFLDTFCTGTPPLSGQERYQEPHRNPPSCTGRPFLDPSWTPSCTGTPPPSCTRTPFLHPFLDTFCTGTPPPSCTWCFGALPHRLPSQTVWSSQTPLSHWGIATTRAMQLRPCLESLGISVVPPRVKLCEAPRSWHHLTRPAHDVTSILRDCRAQN